MAFKRLSMRKIHRVLRLFFEAGLSIRENRKNNPSIWVAGKVSWCWIRARSMCRGCWGWVENRHLAAGVRGLKSLGVRMRGAREANTGAR